MRSVLDDSSDDDRDRDDRRKSNPLVDKVEWKLVQPHREPSAWFESSRVDAMSAWAQSMIESSRTLMRGSPKLIEAVRRGVPAEIRHRVWPTLLGVRAEAKMLIIYQRCAQSDFVDAETGKQIDIDLLRTFPQRPAFARGGVGIERLRRVLHAYSTYDFDVGYVQGINYIAATLLTFMNTFAAFWSLVALMYRFRRRDSFLSEFRGVTRDVWVFRQVRFIFIFPPNAFLVCPSLTANWCSF